MQPSNEISAPALSSKTARKELSMSASVSILRSSAPATTGNSVAARRIRFVDDLNRPASDGVLRRFMRPRAAVAVQEDLGVEDLSAGSAAATDPAECLDVVMSPRDISAELRKKLEAWLAAASPDATPAIAIDLDGLRVLWRPGKAWVQGVANRDTDLPAGLIDFAFYEGELRRLEQSVLPYEATAPDDVDLTFRIGLAGRANWERFGRTIEAVAQLRLTYARLEPQLLLRPRTLPPEGRRLVARLRAKADTADRLEVCGNRIEACEDLYEGAVDRITDYKFYAKGLLLEVGIVVLLTLETALLAWEFFHRH
jgi:hypothetical protein